MKVIVTYWASLGSQPPILGNTMGFRDAGIETEFIPLHRLTVKHLDNADLFFTPSPLQLINYDPDIFTVLQMGGRVEFPNLNKAIEHAELVTMLDPNLYLWLKEQGIILDWKKIKLVPNGLHYQLFTPKTKPESDKFKVLTAKIGGTNKPGTNFIKVAENVHKKGYKQIVFESPVQDPYRTKWSKHINPLKHRPYYKMPALYHQADVYLNVPQEEVLPNSIYEAFMSGLPTVVKTPDHTIGRTQTVPTKYINDMKKDFGTPIDEFDEYWREFYETGDHYLRGETLDQVADWIIYLYENRDERKKYGERAQEWTTRLSWTWKAKCELLINLSGGINP